MISALAAWAGFVQWLAPSVPMLPEGATQNRIVAERLQLDATDSSMLVLGSSMTARLPMASVVHAAQAVGVSGGTAVLAIELARAIGRRPRVAVVETNRLAWPADSSEMREVAAAATAHAAWRVWRFEYRPSTQALAVIIRVTDLARRVLMSEWDKRAAERRAAEAYGREVVDSVQSQRALDRARVMLDAWREAGTTVFLMELPVHPLVGMSPRERRMIERAFPDSLFPRVVLGDAAMSTTDGRHLEADAARRVARVIAAATGLASRSTPVRDFGVPGARGDRRPKP